MELDSYSLGVHIYSVIIIIPTLLFNLLVLYLILLQKWNNNYHERNIILFIVLSDILFSSSIIIRYILNFIESEYLGIKIFHLSLDIINQKECNWSGFLLMITMHSTTYMLAILSYVRYNSIVLQRKHSNLFYSLIIFIPILIIILLASYGVWNSLFVSMPGGLACHIWSPTRNDIQRTPIQILLAYNIIISLIIITYCYIQIALFHRNCLNNYFNRPSIAILKLKSKLPIYPHPYELEELDTRPIILRNNTLVNNYKLQKSRMELLKKQNYLVTYRIIIMLFIIYLCYIPEAVLEQMEILTGWTRSREIDGICTHFRSGYGLANALLLLILHTKTRKVFIHLIRKYFFKQSDNQETLC